MSKLTNWIKNIAFLSRNMNDLKWRTSALEASLRDEIADIKNNQYERDFARLIYDKSKIECLNTILSTTPTIWGDRDRLHISDKAAVNTCLFNVNSGSISIGDYSFAGSGVSILAGSHDPKLGGFLRRDLEFKEGYDIIIGRGVWLASNCTILGPCVIEDDAVIAAGAVVTPGTHICKGEIYAGVPASPIGKVMTTSCLDEKSDKLVELLERENGVVFYSGWSEKKTIHIDGTPYLGHWNIEESAIIYTNREIVPLIIVNANQTASFDVKIVSDTKELELKLEGDDPLKIDIPVFTDNKSTTINVIRIESSNRIFVSREEK